MSLPELLSAPAVSSAALPRRYVFVYGTLRRGEQRDINLLLPKPAFVGHAGVPGVLYDLGAYPGLRLDGSDRGASGDVVGEVYAISPALERLLDEIEEVWPQATGEYARREVPLRVGSAQALLHCLVYEVSQARATGRRVIAGRDWVEHRKALQQDKPA
jgi:gamma-glutamylcyclotransferase (GGCT)/AIG2-like uncharacterized protein YtfP